MTLIVVRSVTKICKKRHPSLHQWSMSSRRKKLWKSVLHRAKHNSRRIWRQETLFPQMMKNGWMLQVKSIRQRFQHGQSNGWGYLQSCQCDGFQNTHENAAANNGDNDIDDDTLIEPPPSHHEALQAKITIEKYIETINRLSKVWSWTWRTQAWTGPDPKCPGPDPDTGGPGPEL